MVFQESCEGGQAKDAFGGRLTQDFVAERMGMGTQAFSEVRELDFPQCSIRTVDLGNGQQFLNLRRYDATLYYPSQIENPHIWWTKFSYCLKIH